MSEWALPDGTRSFNCLNCDKSYSTSYHLNQHQGKCKVTKKRLASLLQETKTHWEKRKRARTSTSGEEQRPLGSASGTQPTNNEQPAGVGPFNPQPPAIPGSQSATSNHQVEPADDLHVPVAQRKARRPRRLPRRYRSDSPAAQPPAPAPRKDGSVNQPETLSPSIVPLSWGWDSINLDGTFVDTWRRGSIPDCSEKQPESSQNPLCSVSDLLKSTGAPLHSAVGVTDVDAGDQTHRIQQPPEGQRLVVHVTSRNTYGITRSYLGFPDAKPLRRAHAAQPLSAEAPDPPLSIVSTSKRQDYGPFATESAFSFAEWYWKSTNKSFRDFQALISIIKNPTFSIPDVTDVNWKAAFAALGASPEGAQDDSSDWVGEDGWRTATLSIPVPFHKKMRDPGTKQYEAGTFRYRPLLPVIKQKLRNTTGNSFHFRPFRATWSGDRDTPPVEVYGELYASRAFRQADEELQRQPSSDRNAGMERAIVALMFWSDGTHLTSFGHANIWPCYLFFGNESKYNRCESSGRLGEQVAYFMKLPRDFKDYLTERNEGALPNLDLAKYCGKVLFQEQWSILLDEELLGAMKHGIIIRCADGEQRCFYPRFFTYSADYPERIQIVGIRNNSNHPCHRCLIKESDLGNLGAPSDTERRNNARCEVEQAQLVQKAQKLIEGGCAVTGPTVEKVMKELSLVPIPSAISTALSPFNFKLIPSLVPDILHEFEIGVWKNLFVHLIRILSSRGNAALAALDYRYRTTPNFGRDTIRKFNMSASGMARKAARDYEDLLQCAISAFELLLPEPHNTHLLTLLYICAQWHALAKLRLHNDFTLSLLEYTTIRLGAQMRLFDCEVCSQYSTKELPKEAEARVRQAAKKGKSTSAGQRSVSLGVFTIKFHLLGDYCDIIWALVTTDSFSTELGESFHRTPKAWYPRTDKKDFQRQFTQMERRLAHLSRIRAGLVAAGEPGPDSSSSNESTPEDIPDSHCSIGSNQNSPVHVSSFHDRPDRGYSQSYSTGFIRKLKRHLLPRLLTMAGYEDQPAEEYNWASVVLQNDYLYRHMTMQILYVTYDVRQDEDVIHVGTPQSNVMLLNDEYTSGSQETPYLYAKVLGIFHANVSFSRPFPDGKTDRTYRRIDFVWVRWYDSLSHGQQFKLDRVSLRSTNVDGALGFMDPADIIRAVHIIPRFSLGKANTLTPPSEVVKEEQLWTEYYINRFADRDLFMRYQYRTSIGHRYMYHTDFPPRVVIPPIPPDFDHGLREDGHPAVETTTNADPGSPPGEAGPRNVPQDVHTNQIVGPEGDGGEGGDGVDGVRRWDEGNENRGKGASFVEESLEDTSDGDDEGEGTNDGDGGGYDEGEDGWAMDSDYLSE